MAPTCRTLNRVRIGYSDGILVSLSNDCSIGREGRAKEDAGKTPLTADSERNTFTRPNPPNAQHGMHTLI
jgi:hypothetical protein